MAWGSAANWFVSETMINEATVIEQKAQQVLEQEYDKFLRQQAQFGKINMSRTY
jgi:Fe-S cluster biosynthesis and repair protein YggX